MLRRIAAIIVSYIVMLVLIAAAATGAYALVGEERAFQAGSYETTTLWNVVMLAIGFSAAVLGGAICRRIAGNVRAVHGLIIFMLVLGILSVIGDMARPSPSADQLARSGETSEVAAMTRAQTPLWSALLSPVVGVAGVALGGRARPNQGEAKSTD